LIEVTCPTPTFAERGSAKRASGRLGSEGRTFDAMGSNAPIFEGLGQILPQNGLRGSFQALMA